MGSHPVNLFIRFLLEIAALVFAGVWGWQQSEGGLRFVLAIGIPVFLAAVWGTFAVPDDPSRSGKAPVPVPGPVRLVIELAIFTFAIWSAYHAGMVKLSLAYAIIILLHYIISYDRIIWLISRKP